MELIIDGKPLSDDLINALMGDPTIETFGTMTFTPTEGEPVVCAVICRPASEIGKRYRLVPVEDAT